MGVQISQEDLGEGLELTSRISHGKKYWGIRVWGQVTFWASDKESLKRLEAWAADEEKLKRVASLLYNVSYDCLLLGD